MRHATMLVAILAFVPLASACGFTVSEPPQVSWDVSGHYDINLWVVAEDTIDRCPDVLGITVCYDPLGGHFCAASMTTFTGYLTVDSLTCVAQFSVDTALGNLVMRPTSGPIASGRIDSLLVAMVSSDFPRRSCPILTAVDSY